MNLIKLCSLCLRTADWLVKHAILAAVVTLLALIAYIQWDNYTVVENADSTACREYKPTAESEVSFDELRAVNPDVIGWITLDGTAVDYPIVQASDNSKYVNTDVFGEFSLTGAIFLDMRNSADFSDTLSIIYGHDMEGNKMFGGFDLYEDRSYFDAHRTGTLFHGGEYYSLDVFLCLCANGNDSQLYNAWLKADALSAWLQKASEMGVQRANELPSEGPILLLSTCRAGVTDGRVLLAATVRPGGQPSAEEKAVHTVRFRLPGMRKCARRQFLIVGIVLLALTVWVEWMRYRKRHGQGNAE